MAVIEFFLKVPLEDPNYCDGCPALVADGATATCETGEFSMRREMLENVEEAVSIGNWRTIRPKGCPLYLIGPQMKRK